MKTRIFALMVLFAVSFSSCYYDNVEDVYPGGVDCKTLPVGYSADIRPIMDAQCIVCHNNSLMQGGISLTSYDQVKIQADNGKLVGSTSQLQGFSPMPKGGKLSQCNIDKIKKWVDEGALNN